MMSGQELMQHTLTAVQSKAARALLGWSQSDLARKANVAVSTVADFERSARSPVANNLDAMRAAFEASGITFALGGAIVGPMPTFPVASRVARSEVKPVRWIDETGLNSWAEGIPAREEFPDLMRRLMLAKFGYGANLRFPAGAAIQLKGWDAQTDVQSHDAIIPSGKAGWELGTNENIRAKADSDYQNRAKAGTPAELAALTFVFATPRYWGIKDSWAADRRAEGIFRDVRVIDGVDLAQLLEQAPSVSLWLAQKLGRVPTGIRLLADAWREWAFSTAIPLTEQLILTGRDEPSTEIHRWLNGDADAIAIQGESTSESIAFLYASLSDYPSELLDAYMSRVVVVDAPEIARDIANVPVPLIVVLAEMDPGISNLLVSKGHHVYQAYGSGIGTPDRITVLPRIGRNALREHLEGMLPEGHSRTDEERMQNLSRDAGGSLTVLRRLMEAAPGLRPPVWAQPDQARALLPLLLAGAWNDDNELDQSVVSNLAGTSYRSVQETLTKALALGESPVRRVGSVWKIASPRDAWFRLSRYIIAPDVEAYQSAILKVLAGTASEDDEDDDEHWFTQRTPRYSDELKQGLVEGLILFGVFGSIQKNVADLDQVSSKIVKSLLDGADGGRWRALAPLMKELAEASPEAFLDAAERSLRSNERPIMELFAARGRDLLWGARSEHSSLLWALEMLAWSEDYLPRVTSLLLQLSDLDPKEDDVSNRPENSLRNIYLPWFPQTNVPLADRLTILNSMRGRHSEAMWKLTLALYPRGHDHATHTPTPMWRSFERAEPTEIVTNGVVWNAARTVSEWILEDVGDHYERWEAVLARLADFTPEIRAALATKILGAAGKMDQAQREKLREQLRLQLHKNREFEEAGWSIPEEELAAFQAAYDKLEPSEPYLAAAWVFREYSIPMTHPPGTDFRAAERLSAEARRDALLALRTRSSDWSFVRDFTVSDPRINPVLVGVALADAALDDGVWPLWSDLLAAGDETGQRIAVGAVEGLRLQGIEDLTDRLLNRAKLEDWPASSVAQVMCWLPKNNALYDWLDESSPEVQRLFWTSVRVHDLQLESRGLAWVVGKLVACGRSYNAAELLHQHLQSAGSALIIIVLEGILADQGSDERHGNEGVMLQYYVEHMFQVLDQDNTLDEGRLGTLEWRYLNVLENSKRPPRMLTRQLSRSPEFFRDMLSLMYRAEGDEPLDSEEPEERERVKQLAHHAYTLFHTWRLLPGQSGDRIDARELDRWVDSARALCAAVGRGSPADSRIGELFAHSPSDPDGAWPHAAVRAVIERLANDRLESGMYIGTRNRRGVTSRGILDGGDLERQEVDYYRGMSKRVRLHSPRTAALLDKIARAYEHEARQFDEEAERRDW